MLPEITSAFSSLKTASEILKVFNSLKTEAALQEKSIELQNIIISLQSSILSLQDEYEKIQSSKILLEKELSDIKSWDNVKQKYILKEIAPKVIAYVPKEEKDTVCDNHWLCANCFDNSKKESIYQVKQRGNIPSHVYYCPQCKNDILIKNTEYSVPKPIYIKRNRNWFDDH